MCYGCPPNNFNGSVTETNGNKIKLSGGSSSRSTPLNEKHISIWGATFLKQPLLVDWSVKGGGSGLIDKAPPRAAGTGARGPGGQGSRGLGAGGRGPGEQGAGSRGQGAGSRGQGAGGRGQGAVASPLKVLGGQCPASPPVCPLKLCRPTGCLL